MKKVLLAGMLGILIVIIACTTVRNVPRVSKDYLKAKLGSPDLVLVDVRSKNDWENSSDKITGAVRMDPKAVDTWLETLPKDREIILYCA
jgi:rhodanese-related sulfurtransferase